MFEKLFSLIDWRQGLIWGVAMGTLVWIINMLSSDYNLLGSSTAAMKQAIYTFFFGGAINRFTEVLAVRSGEPRKVYWTAVTLPIIVTSTLVYLVHSMKGTPSPLLSSLPVIVSALIGFPILVKHIQKKRYQAVVDDENKGF